MKPIINIIDQGSNFKIYQMTQDISDLSLYDRTKAIERFINGSTKTLEILISSDIRDFLRCCGIIIQDGSEQALERAFYELEIKKNKRIIIIDRYYELNDERIIAESPNNMTVIYEDKDVIGCSIEIRLEDIGE